MKTLTNFSKRAAEYDQHARVQKASSLNLVQKALHYINPKKVADIGCGTGITSQILFDEIADLSLTCCDTSVAMLEQVKNKIPRVQVLAQTLPDDEDFDLIISNFSLQWFENPAETMHQCLQKLRSGGILAVAFPVQGTMPELHAAFAQFQLENNLMPYFDEKKIAEKMPPLNCLSDEISLITDIFPNSLAFFKNLHSIGATFKNKNMDAGTLRKIIKIHDSYFENNINVVYRVWTTIYRK